MSFNKNHKNFTRELHKFYAKKIFKMVAMWAASLTSQKILFSKVLNLTARAIQKKNQVSLQNKWLYKTKKNLR
jgi:hypothetical protein